MTHKDEVYTLQAMPADKNMAKVNNKDIAYMCWKFYVLRKPASLWHSVLLLNYLPPEYEFEIIKRFTVYAAMNQDRDLLMELKLVL